MALCKGHCRDALEVFRDSENVNVLDLHKAKPGSQIKSVTALTKPGKMKSARLKTLLSPQDMSEKDMT